MRQFFKSIAQDKTIFYFLLLNGFCIIAAVIFILFSYRLLPPFIPIFNQLPWGEQRLGTTSAIFIPLLIALLILVINAFTSAIAYKKIPLVARMLTATSLLAGILTTLFVVKTIILIL